MNNFEDKLCENMQEKVKNIKKYIEKQQKEIEEYKKIIDNVKEYTHQEIVHYTETIRDYIDDDKEGNKDLIGELKEDREHWKDIEKLIKNKTKDELYMNYWKYGLYE